MIAKKMNPRIFDILFVGVNCFGIVLAMVWKKVSFPAYLYVVVFGIVFCFGSVGIGRAFSFFGIGIFLRIVFCFSSIDTWG